LAGNQQVLLLLALGATQTAFAALGAPARRTFPVQWQYPAAYAVNAAAVAVGTLAATNRPLRAYRCGCSRSRVADHGW